MQNYVCTNKNSSPKQFFNIFFRVCALGSDGEPLDAEACTMPESADDCAQESDPPGFVYVLDN